MMNCKTLILLLCIWGFQAMAHAQELTLDHLYIKVTPGAPEAKALTEAGFKFHDFSQTGTFVPLDESDPRIVKHVGQGTASMSVRFQNIYLELLWIETRELLSQVQPEHRLLAQDPNASPFGVALSTVDRDAKGLPFESTSRWQPWMRPLVSIATAKRDDNVPAEPNIFVVPDYMRWDIRTQKDPKLLTWAQHQLDVGKVTRVRIHGPGLPSASKSIKVLEDQKIVEFVNSKNHLLEIEFDNQHGSTVDLRPTLPLLIRY